VDIVLAMDFDLFATSEDDSREGQVAAIRRGDSPMPDREAAEMLVDSVSGLMTSVATGGPEIKRVDATYKREHRALQAVLKRLDIAYPNKHEDLWAWYGRWSQGDMPKWSDRRVYIAELFAPVRQALAQQQRATHELAQGVGGDEAESWPQIDSQLVRLQRLFREAEDADAYNAVGLQCVKVLTSLGHVVFDADRDLPDGKEEPGRDDAKARIAYFVRRVAPGEQGEEIRKLVNAAYAQANAAKHRHTATRIDAGVAANATALLVSTLRLLTEEDEDELA
jgi:hypothetical protein